MEEKEILEGLTELRDRILRTPVLLDGSATMVIYHKDLKTLTLIIRILSLPNKR